VTGLRFSVFELDQASGELRRQGRRVAIARQAFVVLWTLASRPGELVSREELRRALWPDGTHVDFDRGLNFCVAAARRALGDHARPPRFIETIPTRGYRFLIESHPIAAPPRSPSGTPAACPVTASWRQWAWAAALPCLLAQTPAMMRTHTRATSTPAALVAFEQGDFERATHLDGRFAEAHYALAARYAEDADRRRRPAREALAQARVSAARAVALEEVPESRRLLGSLRLVADWDWDGARRDLARAVELAPAWDLGLASYAEFLSAAGDDHSALEVMADAEALSPGCDLLAWQSARLHYRARRYDTALERLARADALGPPGDRPERDWRHGLQDLAFLVQVQRRDWAAAQRAIIALVQLEPANPLAGRRWAALPAREAVARFLDATADRMRADALRGHTPRTRLALLTVLAGHTDEALAWLEQAANDREADLIFALRDPAFDVLRGLPRFDHLRASITAPPGRRG
jgi:DNA-binding winged helix-turn-helix (wHTH) protein/tetratricopeptide (TPR) repeat protein